MGAPVPAAVPAGPARRPADPGWGRALDQLDAARAAAYAGRDPVGLRRVYADPSLASADVDQLRRTVPAGCGLHGLRTRYTDLRISAGGTRATIVATAALPTSRLVCGGVVRAAVPGAGPTRLRISLVRTATGPRIAGQQLAAG